MDDLLDLNWSDNNFSQQQQRKQQPKQSNDVFADLLSFSSSKPNTAPSLNQQRLQQQEQRQQQTTLIPSSSSSSSPSITRVSANNSISSSSSTTSSIATTPRPLQQPLAPNELLDPFGKSKSKQQSNLPLNALRSQTVETASSSGASSPWNFDLLSPETTSSVTSSVDQSDHNNNNNNNNIPLDPFDMDSLMNVTNTVDSNPSSSVPMEYGEYNDDDDDDDESNPLGLLAQPVSKSIKHIVSYYMSSIPDPTKKSNQNNNEHGRQQQQQQQQQQHDSLLAQLVDMGFGVEESQVALEASGNIDLQSAIDLIVQQTEALRRQQHDNKQQKTNVQDNDDGTSTPSSATSETSFQQQKERLVSQATELGGYFYKNASLLVKSGKQKISKAMEEYKVQQTQQRQGRPKWMTESNNDDESWSTTDGVINDSNGSGTMEKFVDSDDDNENSNDRPDRQMIERMEEERRHLEALRRKQQKEQERQRQQKPVFRSRLVADDDDDDDDKQYISPSRRRQPQQQQKQQQQKQTPSAINGTRTAPATKQPTRTIVEASPTVLTLVTECRQKGNELYKLGQFGDAEVAYSEAIELLPTGHYHSILLSNNRAMTRLKTGHYKQCIEDCDIVLDIAGDMAEGNVMTQGGIEINAKDQIIKALHRKSEALEHMEKYSQALATYEELTKWEGTGNIKVNQALARCRRIVHGSPPAKPSPARKKTPKIVNDYSESKAVSAMRAQAAQQDADDAERLAKTDQVNERIAKWKQGKETNLRALLATLDTLLWSEANWKSIQMSELIQPKKCKINYLKAIGKVHPDKVIYIYIYI
ncbi:uncharacterized protein BX664DRAFT_255676 [Halteromyces radiatus]|uniref:uncharacterized protein n=1 Tax=Halteromyces radiatus TaxID=101107 RepID=UPI00221EA229|nr:uncharacterized protein BX664DRAFT_255676 [Halteromyces radiatus]KAI8099568.1 hypothetical protein BX664DRAFT_255676 [Halteromyces radiatus]